MRNATRYTVGRIHSGEFEVIARPKRTPKVALRPILFSHGYSGAPWASASLTQGSYGRIFTELAKLGAVVISADWGGNLWGNDSCADRFEAARVLAVSLGAKNDRAVCVGTSMGFVNCYGYARQHPSSVQAIFGIAPASSMQEIYSDGKTDNGSINSAYGISGSPIPARFDPTQSPSILTALPAKGKLYYGSADTTVLPSTVTALANALGWPTNQFDTTNVHMSEAQLTNLPFSDLIALVSAQL